MVEFQCSLEFLSWPRTSPLGLNASTHSKTRQRYTVKFYMDRQKNTILRQHSLVVTSFAEEDCVGCSARQVDDVSIGYVCKANEINATTLTFGSRATEGHAQHPPLTRELPCAWERDEGTPHSSCLPRKLISSIAHVV